MWIYVIFFISVKFQFSISQDLDRGLVVSLLPDYMFSSGELATFPGNVDGFATNDNLDTRYLYFYDVTDVVSMACDPMQNTMYVLDGYSKSLYKMDNFNIWLNDTRRNVSLVHQGISQTVSSQITFDWLSRTIYWTDELYNWIGVQPVDTDDKTMYKIIVHDLYQPTAIAVDPVSGFLFWAEHGENTYIERSFLTGENRTVILANVAQIPDLVLDHQEKKIYWLDISNDGIESSNYDGSERQILRRSTSTYLDMGGVTLYKNVVCVTEYLAGTVECLDKRSGMSVWSHYFGVQEPWAIEVYDKELQQSVPHPCETKGCQHFCVNTPQGAKCMCKEGSSLNSDNVTCGAGHNLFGKGIILANGTDMCMIDIRSITGHESDIKCFMQWSSNITLVVADSNNAMVYLTDQKGREITQYNMILNTTKGIASTGDISGLVYDWVGNNIYWSEFDTGMIKVASPTSTLGAEGTLYTGLNKPEYLTINPHNNTLFWIEQNSGSEFSIVAGTLDGKSQWVVAVNPTLDSPTGLFYDVTYNRIFWISRGELKSFLTDGSDSISFHPVGGDTEVIIYKDYALTSSGSDAINVADLHTAMPDVSIDIQPFGNVNAMAIFDPSTQVKEKGPCSLNNGGCEHICIPEGKTRTCRCGYGFTRDEERCISIPTKSDFALVTDYTNGILYQIALDNGVVTALNIPGEIAPLQAAYDTTTQYVYWTDYLTSQILRSTLYGTNKSVVFNTGDYVPSVFQIDSSTGNIYYSAASYDFFSGMTSHIAVIRHHAAKHRVLISELYGVSHIALHPKKGWMFWLAATESESAYIGRSSMDGDNRIFFVSTELYSPSSIAIDYAEDKLYWTDGFLNTISYVGLEDSTRGTLVYDSNADLMHMAINGPFIYYTAINRQFVTKVNKQTGTFSSFMKKTPEFGKLSSISISPGDTMPVHQKCSVNNGLCSTFCLPTPFGRVCACEDGVGLMNDGRTCYGVKKCNESIPNGRFSDDCSSYLGTSCTYECKNGFKARRQFEILPCGVNGGWGVNVAELCLKDVTGPERIYTDSGMSSGAIGGIVAGIIIFFVIIIIVLVLFMYKRRKGSFAHAKFVNSPNVCLNPENAENVYSGVDEKSSTTVASDFKSAHLAAAPSNGTTNPLYETPKSSSGDQSMNQHVYTSLDMPKI